MPLTPVIRDYFSKTIKMNGELNHVKQLHNAMLNKTLIKGKAITIDDVLTKCLTGNHYSHLHLSRPQRTALTSLVVNTLKKCNILASKATDFEVLYDEVKRAIGGINQVGPLILYDTTKMIGHILSIAPKDYVYTQSGAKKGAKILLGMKRMGKKIPTKYFQHLFPGVDSIYIEDMLCIYKKYYKKNGIKKGVSFSNNKSNTINKKKKKKLQSPHCSKIIVNPRCC